MGQCGTPPQPHLARCVDLPPHAANVTMMPDAAAGGSGFGSVFKEA